MKTSLLLTCIVFGLVNAFVASAQIAYPEPSYRTSFEQQVGFTNFKVVYSRPMQRGRVLFGNLVPYAKPWRTGAGPTTRISFDQSVTFGGKQIAKGTYALVTIPGKETWEIILHNDTTLFTENRPYDRSKEAARTTVPSGTTNKHHEAFTISVDIVNNDAVFFIAWGKTEVSFVLQTSLTSSVMKEIRAALKEDKIKTAGELGDAASFIAYHIKWLPETAKDTAIMLVDRAIAANVEPWMYRVKRNIYWFSNDLPGSEKITKEWIEQYRTRPKEKTLDEEIAYIEEEQRRFKATYDKAKR